MIAKKHSYAPTLSSQQKAALKGKAHALKPVVLVGAEGLTRPVIEEIQSALNAHELIKVQIPGQSDAEEKKDATDEITRLLQPHAHFVARVGRMVILYLEKHPEEAKITLKSL